MSRLFRRNRFSTRGPAFVPVPAAQAAPLLTLLRRRYPDLRPTGVRRVRAFGINSQNWKVVSKRGDFILKRVPRTEAAALERQARWTARLSRSGFPAARFITDRRGSIVIRDGAHAYCLSRFEKGSYLGSSAARWKELLRQERRLAAYCLAARGPRHFAAPRRFFTADEARLARRPLGLEAEDAAYIAALHATLRRLHAARRKSLRRAVFHVDIHPLNVLFRGKKLALLADFDSFRETTVEISLGFSVYKCARELLVGTSNRGLRRRVRTLERVVSTQLPGLRLRDLLLYGQMDVLKRLLYIVGEISRDGSSRWNFMLETQLGALREIDAIVLSLDRAEASE